MFYGLEEAREGDLEAAEVPETNTHGTAEKLADPKALD